MGFVGTFITAEVFDLVGVWNSADATLLFFLDSIDDDDDDAEAFGDEGALDFSVLPLVSLLSSTFAGAPLSVVVVVVIAVG